MFVLFFSFQIWCISNHYFFSCIGIVERERSEKSSRTNYILLEGKLEFP